MDRAVHCAVSEHGGPQMPVRPFRPSDMVALASFTRVARGAELTARAWPRIEPAGGSLPYLKLASGAFTRGIGGRRVWLAHEGRTTSGVAVTTPRAGGLAWDVEHLYASTAEGMDAVSLLEEVAASATRHRVRRVFLEMPDGGRAHLIARRAGFERYSGVSLFVLQPGFGASPVDAYPARPRLRADEQTLFHLYNAAVPAPVRAAEALTLEEWSGLYRDVRKWRPSVGGSRQQYVWELGDSLVGWMEVTFGHRSQHITLLVHPRYEDASDRLLRCALLQVSPRAPVYVSAREYQPALPTALEREGFQHVATNDLYVKMLAVRVAQPNLVPASLVGS